MEAEESSQTTPTRLYDITTVKAVVLHLQKHCNSRGGHKITLSLQVSYEVQQDRPNKGHKVNNLIS